MMNCAFRVPIIFCWDLRELWIQVIARVIELFNTVQDFRSFVWTNFFAFGFDVVRPSFQCSCSINTYVWRTFYLAALSTIFFCNVKLSFFGLPNILLIIIYVIFLYVTIFIWFLSFNIFNYYVFPHDASLYVIFLYFFAYCNLCYISIFKIFIWLLLNYGSY